jgi:hypothetical protein
MYGILVNLIADKTVQSQLCSVTRVWEFIMGLTEISYCVIERKVKEERDVQVKKVKKEEI